MLNTPSHPPRAFSHPRTLAFHPQVAYKADGSQYASTCRAGAVKLWDTVSGRCVQTFDMLHNGAQGVAVEVRRQ